MQVTLLAWQHLLQHSRLATALLQRAPHLPATAVAPDTRKMIHPASKGQQSAVESSREARNQQAGAVLTTVDWRRSRGAGTPLTVFAQVPQ